MKGVCSSARISKIERWLPHRGTLYNTERFWCDYKFGTRRPGGLIELDVFEDKLEIGRAVPGIVLGLVSDVEAVRLEEFLFERSHSKADAPDGSGIILNRNLEVVVFGTAPPRGSNQPNPSRGKKRRRIALSEWLQPGQFPHQLF